MTSLLAVEARRVRFTVIGEPQTQAGTRIVDTKQGRRGISTGSKGLKPWRQQVAAAARDAATEHGAFVGPVTMLLHFRFRMPTSRPKRWRTAGIWPHGGKRDDLDKLVRAVFDSLVAGGLLLDDGLVIELTTTKYEVLTGWAGVDVTVTELGDPT